MNVEIVGGWRMIFIMIGIIVFVIIHYELTIGKDKRKNIQEWIKKHKRGDFA